jgi:hypothetical protein
LSLWQWIMIPWVKGNSLQYKIVALIFFILHQLYWLFFPWNSWCPWNFLVELFQGYTYHLIRIQESKFLP